MSTLHAPFPPGGVGRPRRWSKDEYHKMGELGWFANQRVEFMDGEIIQMPNPNPPHCICTDNTADVLRAIFPPTKYWVRMQLPLDCGKDWEPIPDVAVADGPKKSFTRHPFGALLVVEVSETTLSVDRRDKGSLYASVQVPDYWIVNLEARHLEVYRNPVADPTQVYGYRYADPLIIPDTGAIAPRAAPQNPIRIADLLP